MTLPSAYSAILGGGKSRRFGRDKALMSLDGQRIIDLLLGTLGGLFSQIFFISNVRDKFHGVDITTVADEIPNQGPLGGIYTALGAGNGEYCFVTACDTPFLSRDVIQALWEEIEGEDIVVPQSQGMIEPLIGFYARRCRDDIATALRKGQRQIRSFWVDRDVRLVNLDDRFSPEYLQKAFWNINTAADYTIARKWFQEQYA